MSNSINGNIRGGATRELLGWWNAYQDCKSLGIEVKQYAKQAARVSPDYKEATIEQNISHIAWAVAQGYKRAEFKSMGHLRVTRYPAKPKSAPTVKDNKPVTARTVTKADVTRDLREAGYNATTIAEIVKALRLK